MFTQTITALAGAVDKRDPFTSRHSWRVKEIAGDIGRVMRLDEADLEALEWGGLLHDVGKIGVPDDVLLKQERLNKEERMQMNAHPVLGAQIIEPGQPAVPGAADHPPPPRVVQRLGLPRPADRRRDPGAREDPPRRGLVRGDDRRAPVPDDAADRRAGDRRAPQVRRHPVRSEGRRRVRPTHWAEGVYDPGRTVQARPIPMISQHANREQPHANAAVAIPTATAATPPRPAEATRSPPHPRAPESADADRRYRARTGAGPRARRQTRPPGGHPPAISAAPVPRGHRPLRDGDPLVRA